MSGELGAGGEKPETNESVEGDTSWKSRSKNALRRDGQERWESSISQQISSLAVALRSPDLSIKPQNRKL